MECKLVNGNMEHSDSCRCDLEFEIYREATEQHETEAMDSYFEQQLDSLAYED